MSPESASLALALLVAAAGVLGWAVRAASGWGKIEGTLTMRLDAIDKTLGELGLRLDKTERSHTVQGERLGDLSTRISIVEDRQIHPRNGE